ncbi:uncharacterized protein LOC123372784 isoform X3 [Mauremys mutica]|nr:uncharacterized protein LOC123372784 isoform X3 [Mauremys mutica]XP_044877187.1 uncharacterized protein LOC123372784 isoform X3 [Mauremys mutica]XP_044877188.1 uncharacterized protein LOC123372784 isoform X3 [Mauremys mutica]XP_044877189.1 uncharacterized protein LOC123372784 isoform X3 [Mauremys mutica]XP_044877191.1 uncharacterized protein LOC123372784 isoform X3 [Mauremys mutica]XP_044877192.1 uncharacterized protein LOC123372784 isoform X3 [Mauremys mutica]
MDNLALSWMISGRNLEKQPLTLPIDLCYGKTENLNLRYPIHALQAELNFHRSIYNLQVKYTEAVFEGIKQAYHTFQENVVSVLCSPLQDVLSSYINLKAEASEVALRDFLTAFKNNAEQIQNTVDTLTPSKNQHHEGDEALSRFGKEFFLSLEHSLKDCGEQRDKAASEMETLQTELALAFENLQSLRKERKEKKAESIPHFTKSEGGRVQEEELQAAWIRFQKITQCQIQHPCLLHTVRVFCPNMCLRWQLISQAAAAEFYGVSPSPEGEELPQE